MRRLVLICLAVVIVLTAAASSADTFAVRLVSQTSSTITLGWDPQPGYGYLFSNDCTADGVCTLVSRTYDPSRSTVRFAKAHDGYQVAVIVKGGSGSYFTAPPAEDTQPPSVPQGTITSVTANSITLDWNPSTDNVGVDHYNVFLGGAKVAQTTSATTIYTYAGLACGTNYTLGLQAADAAGNVSPLAEATWTPIRTTDCVTPPPTGNATSAVGTSGNDSSCVRGDLTRPCLTLNRAYAISQCGDTVAVQTGTYGDQQILETTLGQTCGGNPIVFRPASGRPVFRHIRLGDFVGNPNLNSPDNLTLQGFAVTWGIDIEHDATNIVVDDFTGGSFGIGGVGGSPTNITIKNSEWGPCSPNGGSADCRNQYTDSPCQGQNKISDDNHNVLIENNVIHDFAPATSNCHFEAIWVGGGTDVTIRNNRFYTFQTNAIALPDNELRGTWLFENNTFGWNNNVVSTTALKFGLGGGCPTGTVIIRYNSFAPGNTVGNEEGGGGCGRIYVVGNILGQGYYVGGGGPQCISGAVYDHNVHLAGFTVIANDDAGPRVMNSQTCGSNSVALTTMPYLAQSGLNPAGDDFHLGAATVADGFVPASTANVGSPSDMDGQARIFPADAGADER